MPAEIMEDDFDYAVEMEEAGVELCPDFTKQVPIVHNHRHNLRHRFELVKTLGEGTYGKVKLAIDKLTQQQVNFN